FSAWWAVSPCRRRNNVAGCAASLMTPNANGRRDGVPLRPTGCPARAGGRRPRTMSVISTERNPGGPSYVDSDAGTMIIDGTSRLLDVEVSTGVNRGTAATARSDGRGMLDTTLAGGAVGRSNTQNRPRPGSLGDATALLVRAQSGEARLVLDELPSLFVEAEAARDDIFAQWLRVARFAAHHSLREFDAA